MKLIKIINAYIALGILAKEKFKFKDSLNIKLLRNKLNAYYEIFADEEKRIVERVCVKDSNGKPVMHAKGYFEFSSDESKNEYVKSMESASNEEVDLEKEGISVITITPPNTITAELLEALDGFVIFKEDTNEGAS